MNTRLLAVTLLTAASLTGLRAEEAKTFKDDKEKANYAIGLNVGNNFKQGNLEYDAAAFDQGMKDAIAGKQGLDHAGSQRRHPQVSRRTPRGDRGQKQS
jgi:hypothetical protein